MFSPITGAHGRGGGRTALGTSTGATDGASERGASGRAQAAHSSLYGQSGSGRSYIASADGRTDGRMVVLLIDHAIQASLSLSLSLMPRCRITLQQAAIATARRSGGRRSACGRGTVRYANQTANPMQRRVEGKAESPDRVLLLLKQFNSCCSPPFKPELLSSDLTFRSDPSRTRESGVAWCVLLPPRERRGSPRLLPRRPT